MLKLEKQKFSCQRQTRLGETLKKGGINIFRASGCKKS